MSTEYGIGQVAVSRWGTELIILGTFNDKLIVKAVDGFTDEFLIVPSELELRESYNMEVLRRNGFGKSNTSTVTKSLGSLYRNTYLQKLGV